MQEQSFADMKYEEHQALLDDWMAARNEHVGELYYPQLGLTPPDPRVCFVSGWNNEWVTPDNIRHYADGIGDRNPLYRSEEYARRTRWGGIIAPPTFLDVIAPTFVNDRRYLPEGTRPLVAGSTRVWNDVIRPGDRIRPLDRYLGVTEKAAKPDRPYRLFVETVRRSYVNERDETIAYADSPVIVIAANELSSQQSALPPKAKHRYSDEELRAILEAYDQEQPRGAETRYWEGVSIGDELTPIVAGPLDATDSWVFMGALGYQAAFGLKWDIIRADPSWAHVDPDTNVYQHGDLTHVLDSAARVRTGTGSYGLAAQAEGLMGHLVTNWMGDDGFLRRLSCQSRRMNFLGDTSWLRGTVVDKRRDGDAYLVDLSLEAVNQDGNVHMPGEATVQLPVRSLPVVPDEPQPTS